MYHNFCESIVSALGSGFSIAVALFLPLAVAVGMSYGWGRNQWLGDSQALLTMDLFC